MIVLYMAEEIKRLFFGLEIQAPWPEELPHGRLLLPSERHLTLAFLGNVPFSPLKEKLNQNELHIPFSLGFAGFFDSVLFLSPRNPNVVAWGVHWITDTTPLIAFQKEIVRWLRSIGYSVDHPNREWLPHATICRRPFDRRGWEKQFTVLPFIITAIHLYESVGQLRYIPLWSHPMKPPFEEIEHTADIAFNIHGKTLQDIYKHALTALAFKHPPLLKYFSNEEIKNLDDIIIGLNNVISKADQESGCPFKAVSFHGEIQQNADHTLTWEMIVDV